MANLKKGQYYYRKDNRQEMFCYSGKLENMHNKEMMAALTRVRDKKAFAVDYKAFERLIDKGEFVKEEIV